MSAGTMATGWYSLKRGAAAGQQSGPFTWGELYAHAQSGALAPDDLVWNPQLPEWTAAAHIPGLVVAPAAPEATPVAPITTSTPSPAGPPPLPAWAQASGPPPLPGQARAMTPPSLPSHWPAGPPQVPRRRHSRLLPVLVPLIALVLVGAGLGVYFGAFYGDGEAGFEQLNAGSTSTSTSTSTSIAATTADLGTIEIALPDPAKLIQTEAWGEVPANQISVLLADGKTPADADTIAQVWGGTVVGEIEYLNLYQIETAGTTESDLRAALDKAAATAGVELAFPNQQVYLADEIWGVRKSPLSDPVYSGELGKGNALIGTEKAWSYIRGSGLPVNAVKMGFIDEGLYRNNELSGGATKFEFPDPAAGEIMNPTLVEGDSGSMVADPTGSHLNLTAGIAGADPNNGGITGIASAVLGNKLTISVIDIYGGKYGRGPVQAPDPNDPSQVVLSDGTSYTWGSIAAALKQVKNNAKVINCSIGARKPSPDNAAVAAAWTRLFEKTAQDHPDVIFVCAAGNENGAISKTNYYPAGAGSGEPNVITVGNVMNDGGKWDTSNHAGTGGEVTISAPGHEAVQGVDADGQPIVAGYSKGDYTASGGGTSAAAPMVSSAAALLLSLKPNLTAAQIKQILAETARPGPENMGGILAIDEAVFEVITMVRAEMRPPLPVLTREQLEAGGVIDAVATTTATPDVYSVRGILAVVPEEGAQVTITASGASVGGDSSQSVPGPAGDAEWPTVTVTANGSATAPTVTVTRKDSGASSVITFDARAWELKVDVTYNRTPNRRVFRYVWTAEIAADASGHLTGGGEGTWHGLGVTVASDGKTEDGTYTGDASFSVNVSGTVAAGEQGHVFSITPVMGEYTITSMVFNSPSPQDELRASMNKVLPTTLSFGFAPFSFTAAAGKSVTFPITVGKGSGTATLTPVW